MNWLEQNEADAKLRGHYDLSPLDTAPIIDETLIDEVVTHNQAVQEIKVRFDMLTDARCALHRPDDWNGHDAEAVIAEHRRVVAESWDVLVRLRRWFNERQAVIEKIDEHLAERVAALTAQRDAAFDAIYRTLERASRPYLKANPVVGPGRLAQDAEYNETVVALDDEIERLNQFRETFSTIRYRIKRDNTLSIRQREVFPHLS